MRRLAPHEEIGWAGIAAASSVRGECLNKTAQATIAKLCLSAAAAFIVGGALRIEQGDAPSRLAS